MKYPKFLNSDSTIGITAPSAGVGKYSNDFDKSINNIKKYYKNIIETPNVRCEGEVSSKPNIRAKELQELFENEKVDMIMCATGGDFLTDMLPYINYEVIEKHPKWIMGASDPTNLLFTITINLDIATIYGHNAASFDSESLYESQKIALNYLCGNISKQNSYPKYENDKDHRINGNYNLDKEVYWLSDNRIDITGRLIGGCIDCLRYLPGTKYDKTTMFIEKYKEDGIIWYFDIFNMSAEDFYLTLFQLKEAGWFKYTKGIIIGRVFIPSSFTSMTYKRAVQEMLKDIPIILDADIGHVCPKMTLINGCLAHITCENGKGYIEQELK